MYKFDVLVRREIGTLEIVLCGENFPNLLKRCAEFSALVRAPPPYIATLVDSSTQSLALSYSLKVAMADIDKDTEEEVDCKESVTATNH